MADTNVKHWHIGSNVPGYLPESDVWPMDGTVEDATRAVMDEATRGWEFALEGHELNCAVCGSDDEADEDIDCADRPYLIGQNTTDIYLENRSEHDLGVHFWADDSACDGTDCADDVAAGTLGDS